MDEEREVAITYEKLYELLRFEKSRDELQAMDSSFFSDLLVYLKEKEKIYINARNKVDLFSMAEKDTVQIQLSNIKRIIKELYERREKKVITMAINKSRTQSSLIDTSNMLAEEQLLFKSLVGELDFFRQGILHNLFLLKLPSLAGKSVVADAPKMTSAADFANQPSEFDSLPSNSPFESAVPESAASVSGSSLKDLAVPTSSGDNLLTSTTILVKFIKSMPQLVGEELELYGPFEPDDEAKLPSEIAKLVISEGSAVEC